MNRLRSDELYTHELDLNDISRGRTDLLILMAKDLLDGKPLGPLQRKVMDDNALNVELICRTSIENFGQEPIDSQVYNSIRFFYYLKSLAGMMKSVARGIEVDEVYHRFIHDHVHVISEMLEEDDRMNDRILEDSLSLMLLKLVAII